MCKVQAVDMQKRKPRFRYLRAMACGMLMLSPPAMAELQWDFSGFASIGAGKLSDNTLTFMDYTGDEWSMDSDSALALQAIVQTGDRWSLTGQVLSKGFSFDERNPYEPRLEWLFASYELSPELRVRGGRLRTPHFLYSESLEIGYSYPWVRPPIEMYANFLEPFANFDGIDLTLQKEIGSFENEFKIFGGHTEGEYRGRDVNIEKTGGFAVMSRWDAFTFRYCYNWNRLSLYDPKLELPYKLFQGFAVSEGEPIFNEIADTLHLESKVFQYHGLGMQWEHGAWTVIAEKLKTEGPGKQFSFENDGWYLTVAHQIEDWMPYVSVGEYRSQMDPAITKRVRESYNAVNAGSNVVLDILRELTILGIDDLSVYHRTVTAGIRYDFHSNAALKLEAEYFNFLSTGQMLFDHSKPEPDSVLATSIVIDVVF